MNIEGKNIREILVAIVPLYVSMILAYGSIRWWKIFTPEQFLGISRFVAVFAVPFLTFHFISTIDLYHMNKKFIAADTLQKFVIGVALFLWSYFTKHGSLEWSITVFSLSTLPNTLLVGVPLLSAMYGESTTSLLIQLVVLQSVVWYNLLLFLYEYRAAKRSFTQQFHETNIEGSNDDVSPNIRAYSSVDSNGSDEPLKEAGDIEMGESKQRASGLSSNRTEHLFNNNSSLQNAGFEDQMLRVLHEKRSWRSKSCAGSINVGQRKKDDISDGGGNCAPNMRLHTLVWNSRTSPASNVSSADLGTIDISKPLDVPQEIATSKEHEIKEDGIKLCPSNECQNKEVDIKEGLENQKQEMPSTCVMTKLILIKVWIKLIRNPNTHAAILGLVWSLISFRWNIKMPSIIKGSISLMSNTGLGMAMFSLGGFMGLQPKVIACGKTVAAISMAIRFLVCPATYAATSAAVGIRGPLFQVAVVQAAIPQGIVPFVFAKEYNVHAEVLSTAVIFGMAVTLPVTVVYYMLLGLL